MSVGSNVDLPFIFVIQTDQYAGNFEREMTGYITGVDDGTHGDEEGAVFHDEVSPETVISLGEKVAFANDENGYSRCCSIWNLTHPGDGYNDVAIFFHVLPTAEDLNVLAARSRKYGQLNGITIRGFAIIRREIKITDQVKSLIFDDPA